MVMGNMVMGNMVMGFMCLTEKAGGKRRQSMCLIEKWFDKISDQIRSWSDMI